MNSPDFRFKLSNLKIYGEIVTHINKYAILMHSPVFRHFNHRRRVYSFRSPCVERS